MSALLLAVAPAFADPLSYVGDLDMLNANDVRLISFTLTAPGDLDIQSWGYGGTADAPGGTNAAGSVIAAGGFDTYLSLFDGLGDSATFHTSNDDGDCPVGHPAPACRDSHLSLIALPAGSYTLAISVFSNMSFAETSGVGTLGDGFIGLGSYYDSDSDSLRGPRYAVDITTPALPVPEPSTLTLMALGVAMLAGRRFRGRPAASSPASSAFANHRITS